MALKLDIRNMPVAVRVVLMLLPAVIISALVIIFLILPRHKEIKRLNAEITKQENEIARNQAKAAKLPTLKLENEKLKKRLDELKLQLPEEKEVSGLLKQVSDLGIKSGLRIVSWKPEHKKDHPSGIIYEIPVSVEMSGSYHSLGIFFSSLTKLNRIVNISDIKIGDPKPQRNEAVVKITFKATTFSAVPEGEMAAKAAEASKAAAGKAKKK
ncbi:MAG: hypothetical protein OHK0032_18670 [Thermodesulfovibrionales bacterium]